MGTTAVIAPEDAVALEMVKLGYATESPDPNDDARNLMFRAKFETLDTAQAAVRAIGEYNDFDGDAVATALEHCDLDAGYGTWAEIGREYSPVIYVRVSGEDFEAVMAAMRDANASEVSRDGLRVRAWWD